MGASRMLTAAVAVLAFTAAYGASVADTGAQCSFSVSVVYPTVEGDQPRVDCSSQCQNDQGTMWFNGVAYKRFPALQEQYNQMVAVAYEDGEFVGCSLVPYTTDDELNAKVAQVEACLGHDEPEATTEGYVPDSNDDATTEETTDAPATTDTTTSTTVAPVEVCQSGFTPIGGSCYMITSAADTRKNQNLFCKSIKAQLAAVESDEEQESLAAMLPESVYIFMNDISNEGKFKTHGGVDAFYSNWNDDEPNNVGNEDCVAMKDNKGFRWNDVRCSKHFRGLCEVPMKLESEPLVCRSGSLQHGSSCYRVSDAPMSHQAGQDFCQTLGGYLAQVNSEGEQNYLSGVLEDSVYTGLIRDRTTGKFVVPNFGLQFFNKWAASQPDDASGSDDCTVLDSSADFSWNDVSCEASYKALCEMPAEHMDDVITE